MDQYHPLVYKIRKLLDDEKISYEFFEHEPVRTSEEAHALRPGFSMSQGAKALIVKAKMAGGERKFVQCIMPADLRLDSDKVKNILGAKSISFASQEESDTLTGGVEFGGIPPFGNLFGLSVYTDPKIRQNETIIFNCGDRRATIAMNLADWILLVKPVEINIVK